MIILNNAVYLQEKIQKDMKRLVYVCAALLMMAGCRHSDKGITETRYPDGVVLRNNGDLEYPNGTVIKKSGDMEMWNGDIYYANGDIKRMTGEYIKREDFEWPDTIKVAFTRDGVFEDSVEARKWDGSGTARGMRYIYAGATWGDIWTYTGMGEFVSFHCTHLPHSGKPHHYKP